MNVEKIISGGQTGVDRAALDAAMARGLVVGGWCPRGRRAEDGPIDRRYPLQETPTTAYAQRTAWNVRDSDGTLILTFDAPTGGTARTIAEAQRRGRPLVQVRLMDTVKAATIRRRLATQGIKTLNVAGPREREAPGIYRAARDFMEGLLE